METVKSVKLSGRDYTDVKQSIISMSEILSSKHGESAKDACQSPLIIKDNAYKVKEKPQEQDDRIKGFGGSEQFTFEDSRKQLPYLIDPKVAVPIWKIISKVAG